MANPWFRLWSDMVNDPKFRTIARVSKQEVSRVLSVYLYMMTCASNATERGRTEGWCDEDVATALNIDTSDVEAIREAMQGRVLDGDYLTGWEKRQPLKEDGAAERAKAWREAKKAEKEREQTQQNETERSQTQEEIRVDTDKKQRKSKAESATATRLPANWIPSLEDARFCADERPDLSIDATAQRFRDYWIAQPGQKGRKLDWSATWRNWVRNEKQQARASPGYQDRNDKTKAFADALTGRRNDNTDSRIIDITPGAAAAVD